MQPRFLVKRSLGTPARSALGPSSSCAPLTLLPLTACASEGGLELPTTLGEGDRDGWKMSCFSEAEGDGGLLQGTAELVWFLGCFHS